MLRHCRNVPQARPTQRLLTLVLLGSVAVWPVVAAAPAAAHDVLVNSSPVDGAIVSAAPDAVQLTFSERVLTVGAAVRVTGPTGQIQVGSVQIRGVLVSQALRPGAPDGRYVVRWQVASNDGHPVAGRLTYTVRGSHSSSASSMSPGVVESRTPTATASSSPSTAVDESTAKAGSATSRTPLVAALLLALGASSALGVLLVRRRRR